ncbi:hypothetical protein K5D32_24615 [Pseudomonas cichorii]|uniref:hypothetical protein n=1 Tax=Pseudomonas cichorii TaxID=36746 RepID=UPI001C88F648|nr:hypothetical protein [Pseudomonas cichorii]MBX8532854.1 hypothetical protein [Pseudomonas cichorii]
MLNGNELEACSAIKLLLEDSTNGAFKGLVLEVLREIDAFLYCIHPRALLHPSMDIVDFDMKHWARSLKAKRIIQGCYFEEGGYKVVPRGPLVRLPRPEYASSATSFSDRFSALSVVPCILHNEMIALDVRHVAKSSSIVSGVKPGRRTGQEIIAFIPVAEKSEDMVLTQRSTSASNFIDYKVSPKLDVASSIATTLRSIGYADIAIAPELVVSVADSLKLVEKIRLDPGRHRLLLAGTGHTEDVDDGQAWNEGRVVNGLGTVIWKQRKFWQAGIDQHRARDLNLNVPDDGRHLLEDNASGEEVVIADIDGFGRCIMLICQDVQAKPISDELIRLFQPDWVFAPILDVGISDGRWSHSRTFELSALSPARFLVVTSTSLADKMGKSDVACGLAVGPKGCSEVDEGRIAKLAVIDKTSGNSYSLLEWQEDWGKTTISIDN